LRGIVARVPRIALRADKLRSKALAVLSASLIACVAVPEVAAAGELDQQQTLGNGTVVFDFSSLAQTFTAGKSGSLDQVDLELSKSGPNIAAITVQIRSVSAGAPGTQVLSSASIQPSQVVTGTPAFVPVGFAAPASVAAGAQYAIVVFTTGMSDVYRWVQSTTNPYPVGSEFSNSSSPPTTTWNAFPADDFAFKTYVAPPAPAAAPGPTGKRAAALKKCKKKRSKKAKRKCRKRAKKLPV
jgi:hypothetical protein